MTLATTALAGDGEALRSFHWKSQRSGYGAEEFEFVVPASWQGKYGATLSGETIRLRLTGNLRGPKVFILGGISAGRFVAEEPEVYRGWWGDIVNPGGSVDLDRYCIIGADYPPILAKSELPLCPEDFADLYFEALKQAGVHGLHAFVGSSFGGMIGLAFARKYTDFLINLAVLCAAHRPHPMAQAWRLIQRQVITLAAEAGAPERGIELARQLAMTTYRTPKEFKERFNPRLNANDNVFHYLRAQGQKYSKQASASRYLTLSSAIDHHDEQPEEIKTNTLLVGALSDQLVPLEDIAELRERLGGPAELVAISSLYGHDAFLKEGKTIGPHLQKFLAGE